MAFQIKLLLSTFFISFLSTTNAQELIPFKKDKLWGFMQNKNTAINPNFDYVTNFSEGFALVKKNNKWGYIDSLGTWFIEAQFDNAQPLKDGFAFIEKAGKTGIIQVKLMPDVTQNGLSTKFEWNYIVNAEYDVLERVYSNAFQSTNNGKKGYIEFKEEENQLTLVPCEYDDIDFSRSIVCAKKNGKWDFFNETGKIFEGADEKLDYYSYQTQFNSIIVPFNGKYGLYNYNEKKWTIPSEFKKIESIASPEYKEKITNKKATNILIAHSENVIYDEFNFEDELLLQDSFLLYKVDGTLISPIYFHDLQEKYEPYGYDIPKSYAYKLKDKNKLYTVDKYLNVNKLKYQFIYEIQNGNYYIAENNNKSYILNKNQICLDSFDYVTTHKMLNVDPDDPYAYETSFSMSNVNENYLICLKYLVNDTLFSIYNLFEHKLISPWHSIEQSSFHDLYQGNSFHNNLSVNILGNYNELTQYIWKDKSGFFHKSMEVGGKYAYSFSPIIVNGSTFAIFYEDLSADVYIYTDKIINKIKEKCELSHSSVFVDLIPYYEFDENGEPLYEDYIRPGVNCTPFFITKENKKYGVITGNGKVYKSIYDTILFIDDNSEIIQTKIGALNGVINVYRDQELYPFTESALTIYSPYYINNAPFYLLGYNENGTEITKSFNNKEINYIPTTVSIKQEGKGYTLVATPFGDGKENESVNVIEESYKYISETELQGWFIVENKKKKKGLINAFGDTVIPVQYTSIELNNSGSDNVYSAFVYNKSKMGYYDIEKGELIAPKYENISSVNSGDYISNALEIHQKKKVGLYFLDEQKTIEPIYDAISERYTDNNLFLYELKKGNLKYFYYKGKLTGPIDFCLGTKVYTKKNDSYSVKDLNDQTEYFIKANDFVIEGNMFNIFTENGLFGAKNKEGKILIPAEYESADFMQYRDEVMIGYQNGTKYYIYVENNQRYTEQEW